MTKRNPFLVFLLPFLTCGIYGLIWYVTTKEEMNVRGAGIPTAWLLIVPIANIWWMWRYAKGVEKVTNGGMSAAADFWIRFFLGPIGMAITQSALNRVA